MTCWKCALNSFQIRAQKHYGPFHWRAPPLSCGLFLVFVTLNTRAIANRSIFFFLLFSKKYTSDSFDTSIRLTAYRPLLFRIVRTVRLKSVFVMTQQRHSSFRPAVGTFKAGPFSTLCWVQWQTRKAWYKSREDVAHTWKSVHFRLHRAVHQLYCSTSCPFSQLRTARPESLVKVAVCFS